MRTLLWRMFLLCLSTLVAVISPGVSRGTDHVEEEISSRLNELNLRRTDLSALNGRQVVVRAISSNNEKEIAGFGVVIAAGLPDAFIESYASLTHLRSSQYVTAAGRFGDSPSISDMGSLTIDNSDLYALFKATPGDSRIKLSESEITQIRKCAQGSTSLTPRLKQQLAAEYRKLLLNRITSYIKNRSADSQAYADQVDQVNVGQAFSNLAREHADSRSTCYAVRELLTTGAMPQGRTVTFFYWAKQRFGEAKPVISLVEVTIQREGSRTFMISRQIYSSHYTEAAMTVAEFIPFGAALDHPRTLVVFTIRMQLDMLGGSLGFVKKRLAEPRVLLTLKESLSGLRLHLEEDFKAKGRSIRASS